MGKTLLESAVEALALPVAEKYDLELLEVEFVKEGPEWYLRLYIDRKGGVNIIDCENVSREIDPLLDELDAKDPSIFTHTYRLEVSSSGDRPLKNNRDFERNIGNEIDISFYKPFNGRKVIDGVLKGYDEKKIIITENSREIEIDRELISVIKLSFKF